MKCFRVFAVVLFALVLTPLQEIAKIPVLISHFMEHQSANKDTTLSDFIVEHYGNPENLPEHQKLPLKSLNLGLTPVYEFHKPIELHNWAIPIDKSYPLILSDKPTTGESNGIFQPPRLA
jgi:hypothetical protein